jgi:seryl-tRNA synthetase
MQVHGAADSGNRSTPSPMASQARIRAIDLRFVKDNADLVAKNAADRAVVVDVPLVLNLYDRARQLTKDVEELRRQRNRIAELMKSARTMSEDELARCVADGKKMRDAVSAADDSLQVVERALEEESCKLPNLSHPDVPVGPEENAVVLRVVGQKRDFAAAGLTATDHLDTARELDMVDFESASRVCGSKFYFMRNAGALLELALINWAMNSASAAGFTVMTSPDVARESIMADCGFQPRDESGQTYRIEDSDLCLVGTAEIPLAGYFARQILDKANLPIKMAAFSHCFRREVGTGANARGLYRVHQFSKVELFVISHPEESEALHTELREIQESMFESLGLHFRVLDMPTHDLGAPAHRKYDIEAWMPGRDLYGEISSASNCTDYQARRLNIRYRGDHGVSRFAHTLNATACAVPRMIVAILENNLQVDGSVLVPEPLRPFMGGMDYIRPPSGPRLSFTKVGDSSARRTTASGSDSVLMQTRSGEP